MTGAGMQWLSRISIRSALLVAGAFATLFALYGLIVSYPLAPTEFFAVTTWVGSIISSLFPWPFLIIFLFCFKSSRTTFLNLFESISAFISDADIFNVANLVKIQRKAAKRPDASRRILYAQARGLEENFDNQIEKLIKELNIENIFQIYFRSSLAKIVDNTSFKSEDHYYRATIHIMDCLYPEVLYQVLDYQSSRGILPDTSRRRNSFRFGIIGTAWRLGKIDYDPEVSTDDDNDLIKKWGMTRAEANKAGKGQRSHLALPVKRRQNEDPIFIIFMDGTPKNCFGNGENLHEIEEILTDSAKSCGLTEAMVNLRTAIDSVPPVLPTSP